MSEPNHGGAVSSPHALATRAGENALRQGGTAMDAAVATNAMLSVVYPHMCGVGGDMFMLYFEAGTQQVHCLNATGPAPRKATREFFGERGRSEIPARGAESVTVPGTVAGWESALEKFGRLGLARAIKPAAAVADKGFVISPGLARWIEKTIPEISGEGALHRLLHQNDKWLSAGETLRFPDLATTLHTIASEGSAEFYAGAIGRRIAQGVSNAGGPLTVEDLAAYTPEWVEPISTTVNGFDLYVPPPNSQGTTALLLLQEFFRLGGSASDERDSQYYERFIKAKKHSFDFRDRYIGDPRFHSTTLRDAETALNGKSPAQERPSMSAYPPMGDTVGLVTRDSSGNACAVIQSLYYGFGSLFVPEETGVLLHNRGHYFSLEQDRVNSLEPGKRTMHTLMCLMALQGGEPRFVISSMGADGQPQFVSQVLLNLMSGVDPQAAIDSPRILHGRFVLQDHPNVVRIEPIDPKAATELAEAGHTVEIIEQHSETMGHAQAIEISPDGIVLAGYDPRSDGDVGLV